MFDDNSHCRFVETSKQHRHNSIKTCVRAKIACRFTQTTRHCPCSFSQQTPGFVLFASKVCLMLLWFRLRVNS